MNTPTKKPVQSVGADAGLDTSIQNYSTNNYSSKKPLHPAAQDRINIYKAFNAESNGLVLVFDDAARFLEVPTGTPQVMVIRLGVQTIPQSYSWYFVEGLQVDLYTAGASGSLERTMVNELLCFGAIDINLFQIEFGELLSPLLYTQKELMQVAA